ncbi:MAG: hypothetical protein AAFX87_09795 [Bacteroidota bacterium]
MLILKFLMIVALSLHLYLAYKTQLMIDKAIVFTTFQKRINSLLSWLIPFFWAYIVRFILKSSESKTMTKKDRDKDRGGFSDNWWHLTGGGGSH